MHARTPVKGFLPSPLWDRAGGAIIRGQFQAALLVDGALKATVDDEPRRLLLLVRFQPVP
jgi:hypothetical protein